MLIATNGVSGEVSMNTDLPPPDSDLNADRGDIRRFLGWFFGLPVWKELNREPEIRIRLLPSGQEYRLVRNSGKLLADLLELNEDPEERQNIYFVSGIAKTELGAECCKDKDVVCRPFLLMDLDQSHQDIVSYLAGLGVPWGAVWQSSARKGELRHQAVMLLSGAVEPSPAVVSCNKQLIQYVGADPKTYNHSRLMRLPGTLNWKVGARGEQEETTSSRLIGVDTTYSGVSLASVEEKVSSAIRLVGNKRTGDVGGASIGSGELVGATTCSGEGEFVDWNDAVNTATNRAAGEEEEVGGIEPVTEGGRNNALTYWAGCMVHARLDLGEIEANLELLRVWMCSPAVEKGELQGILKQLPGWEKKAKEEQKKLIEVRSMSALPELPGSGVRHVLFRQAFANQLVSTDAHIVRLLKAMTRFTSKYDGDGGDIARFIADCFTELQCNFGRYYQKIRREITPWNTSVVMPVLLDKEDLISIVSHGLREAANLLIRDYERIEAIPEIKSLGKAIIRTFKATPSCTDRVCEEVIKDRGDKDLVIVPSQPPSWAVFQNGVFDTATGVFTPDKDAPLKYPNPLLVDYVEERPDPSGVWEKYLNFAFGDEDYVASAEVIYRMIGILCTRRMDLSTMFVLQGATGAGKSTIRFLIAAALGKHNTHRTKYKLLGEKFALSTIGTKIACFIEEAESTNKQVHQDAGALLKELADGGEELTNRKMRSDEVLNDFYCKMVLLTNDGLSYDDSKGAFQRRLVTIMFRNTLPKASVKLKGDLMPELYQNNGAAKVISEGVRRLSAAWVTGIRAAMFDCGSIAVAQGKMESAQQMNPIAAYLDSGVVRITGREEDFIPSAALSLLIKQNVEGMDRASDQLIARRIARYFEDNHKVKSEVRKMPGGNITIRGIGGARLNRIEDIKEILHQSSGYNRDAVAHYYPGLEPLE